MDRDVPRAPWLRRLPSGVWTALSWCAAGEFALLLFMSTTFDMAPPFGFRHPAVAVGFGVRAALAVLLALPVCWARRWPAQVFGVLLAESAVVLLLGGRTWPLFVAMDVLLGYLAAVRPGRVSVLAGVAEFAVWFGGVTALRGGVTDPGDLVSTVGAFAAGIAIPWAIGNSVRQQHRYSADLRAYAARQAITDERLRIARELHDVVAHSIGVIAIQAGAASMVLDVEPAGARRALDAIEATSRETLSGLRRMLVSLRHAETGENPSTAVPLAGLEAVDRLAATMAQAGVEVDVRWQGLPRPLPPEIDLAAFRIVQESVTNVLRHAGADRCEVHIAYQEQELTIEVLDDGDGGTPGRATVRRADGTGYGIAGMRERVALLNGRFSANSRPEGGFRVAARLPA
ncbi:sensor histidine kinase [Kitasatospora sp. CB01950]|uniref:sensor histidine kinase n=1 Tax=Kitasatospora sp. CB01950 TaxID=1703930 RepID=UPI00093AB955|nr:sensor histidine kinase [Kitasatospora sp. CB01950]OKJ09282.1 histidine kinase [Kitasatospora sp. CB01950]